MRFALARLLLPLLLLAPFPGAAATAGLYEAQAPVASQAPELRDAALKQALAAVLVKVSGSRDINGFSQTANILEEAPTMVQSFGYETTPSGLTLLARFDGRAVEAALRRENLPVWGASRPQHLLWLAIRDEAGGRTVVDETTAATRAAGAVAAASERGVSLLFPLPDASGPGVDFNAIWDEDAQRVREVSRQYPQAQAVLLCRAWREGSGWTARWSLLGGDGARDGWASQAPILDVALASGIHQLADRQAARLVVRSSGAAQELVVRVSGVADLRDYGRALTFLKGLSPVRGASVDGVEGDTVTYRLRMDGDTYALARAIGSGNVLRPLPGGDNRGTLVYGIVR